MESNIIEMVRIQGRAALKVLDGKINYGIDDFMGQKIIGAIDIRAKVIALLLKNYKF